MMKEEHVKYWFLIIITAIIIVAWIFCRENQ